MLLIDLIKEIRVISFKFKCRVKKINVEVFCTKKKYVENEKNGHKSKIFLDLAKSF
jgi:hypothetical protein